MKLVRFVRKLEGQPRFGALLDEEQAVLDLSTELSPPTDPLHWYDLAGALLPQALDRVQEVVGDRDRIQRLAGQGAIVPLSSVRLLAPVRRPPKVIGVGLNYRDHAEETGAPIPEAPALFSKFSTTVIGPHDPVVRPRESHQLDYEAELGVVIGRGGRDIAIDAAYDHVLGYTNVNDVSARDFQFGDPQWLRGKSCDTFCPTGPWLVTPDEIPDPHRLGIRLRVNGETRQDASTSKMIFSVPELIAYVSRWVTLEPGDLIATGTPAGVGFARTPPLFLQIGDEVEVEIEGLGVLCNPISG